MTRNVRQPGRFKFFNSLRQLCADQSGASILVIGLSFLALAGFVGLSVEIGYWYYERRAMQSATDEAALAGAYVIFDRQLNNASIDPEITAAAKNDAKRNGYDDAAPNVAITVNHPSGATTVEVQMTKDETGSFSRLFGVGPTTTIARRAVAQASQVGNFCMLGLDPTCPEAVRILGSFTGMFNGCPIQSNSSAPGYALHAGGNAEVTTPLISSAANTFLDTNFTQHGGTYVSNAQPMPDPLVELPEYPNPGGCQPAPTPGAACNPARRAANYLGCSPTNPIVLNPGCYNDLSFNQNEAYFKFNAGNYYTDGVFKVGGQTTVESNTVGPNPGVTIHLGPNGTADVRVGATLNLFAPTSGTYAGILFFQSRSAPPNNCGPSYANQFNGGANQNLEGVLYFKNQGVALEGNDEAVSPGCLKIVSRYLRLSGSGVINTTCPVTGPGGGPRYLPPTLIQ